MQGMDRQPIFEPHVHIKSDCRSGQSVNKSHDDYKISWMSIGDGLVDTNTHDLSRKPRHAMLINRHNVQFKVDTGSPIALIGENIWKNIGSHRRARSRIKVYAYGSNTIALRASVQCKSNVVRQCYHSPRCCKQRCFVAWPELDSSFPIRQQRTIVYAKVVSRCAHSWCAWDCTKMNAELQPRITVCLPSS